MLGPARGRGCPYAGFRQCVPIGLGVPAAKGVPAVQVPQLDAKNGRLDRVQALVPPFGEVDVLARLSKVPEEADSLGELVLVSRDCASVTVRAKVLRRVEAEGCRVREAAGPGQP
jgi:hypothetical protein